MLTGAQIYGHGETVLVVEDDSATRQALQALLEAHDYRVVTASDGKEALARYEEAPGAVSLVVSDIVMPEMGGVALYRTLRKRWPGLKMLFVTGHPLDKDSQALLEHGEVHWLQKPFSVQEFNQTVQVLLRES
jgi:CheY-like chemotaxis protein